MVRASPRDSGLRPSDADGRRSYRDRTVVCDAFLFADAVARMDATAGYRAGGDTFSRLAKSTAPPRSRAAVARKSSSSTIRRPAAA